MSNQNGAVNRVAPITNLHLVSVALEQLTSRQAGLPGIGVIYGPAGRGKTIACSAIANRTRAYYIQMRSAWNRKTLLEKVLLEMGIKPVGTIPSLLDLVCEQLAASDRPLIIDEADVCMKSDGMIELVRDIYEGSQGTLLLVGEENMPGKLKRWERFHSRVLSWIPAQPVSIEDAKALVPIYSPEVKLADCMLEHLVNLASGSVRRVCVNLAKVQEDSLVAGVTEMTLKEWGKRDLYTGDAPRRRK